MVRCLPIVLKVPNEIYHFQVQFLDIGGTVTDNIGSFFFNRVRRFYKEKFAFCMCVCWLAPCCNNISNWLVWVFLPRDKCIYSTYFLPQNSNLTIEEFHSKLQEATNFPLRPFVIPFLKVLLSSLVWKLFSNHTVARSQQCFCLGGGQNI